MVSLGKVLELKGVAPWVLSYCGISKHCEPDKAIGGKGRPIQFH